MSKTTDYCSFVAAGTRIVDSKKISHELVLLENMCLRSELARVSGQFESDLKEHTNKIETLSVSLAKFEGEILEFKAGQSEKLEAHKSSQQVLLETITNNQQASFSEYKSNQQQVIDQHTEMYTASLTHYDHWTIGLTVLIAIAGLSSIAYITNYKKRETDKIIDNAVDCAKDKLDNDRLVQSAVVNAFETDGVKNTLNAIKIDIMNEQEPYIRSIIQDTLNNGNSTDADEFQSILNGSDDDD